MIQHLAARGADGLVFFHAGNNPRSARDGARLKRLGLRAGVSDLIFVHNGQAFALELKSDKGRVTPEQDEFMADFRAAGGYAWCAHGIDEAIITLEHWGILRRAPA